MSSRLPVAIASVSGVVLFGSIAFVSTLVVMSLVTGEPVDFVGETHAESAAVVS